MPLSRLVMLLSISAIAAPVLGQDGAAPAPTTTDVSGWGVSDELWEPGRWSLQLEPSVWFAAMGGDVQAGNGTKTKFKDINDDADDPNAALSLRGLYRSERWTVLVDGFYLDMDEGGAGSSIDFTLWSADASVGYELFEWKERRVRGDGTLTDTGAAVRVIPYAGFRIIAPDMTIDLAGETSGSDEFLHPLVGLRLEVEVFDRFSFDTGADIGGFDLLGEDAFAFDWTVNLRAHITPNIAAHIGFRQMFMDIESDDVLLDGSVGGLMAGVTIRF